MKFCRTAVFRLQDREGGSAALDGQFDGHLGDLVDLGSKPGGMGVLFQDPVGNGVQIVQPGTGMGVKIEEPVFTSPEFLHAGKTLKNKPHIAVQRSMDFIQERFEFPGVARLLHHNDAAGRLGLGFFKKLEKEVGAAPLTLGKAVQDDEAWIIGQIPQLIQQIFRRPVKTDINYGFLLTRFQGLICIRASRQDALRLL